MVENIVNKYDYIVIGSGTGGVVATRLAQSHYNVLLIEAGPNDLKYSCNNCNSWPHGDMLSGTIMVPFIDWWFRNVNQLKWYNNGSMPSYWNYNKTILNRKDTIYTGKMLGGSLSHNGHAWHRGSHRDYNYVSQINNLPDWSYNSVLPYFKKIETYLGENKTFRGSNGPIEIRQNKINPYEHKLKALFNTAINYGIPYNNHQNSGFDQYGIGFCEINIGKYTNNSYGLFNTTYYRESSAQSYVRNIGLPTDFLTVWYNTTVQRILFENNKAIGVEYWYNNTQLKSVYCNKEVILSAGVYQSPQILMLSGIGPSEQLNKFNIKPIGYVQSHEYIGKNGQDHTIFNMRYHVDMSKLNTILKPPKGTWIKINNKHAKQHLFFPHKGRLKLMLSSNKYNRLGYDYNDIQISCFDFENRIRRPEILCTLDSSVYSKHLTIKLNSNDSRIYPSVYYNYFINSTDYDIVIEGIKKLRSIFQFNKTIFVKEIYPGINKSDQELKDIIWKDARTEIHGVGTISMGDNNNIFSKQFPINSKCSLRGVDSLRVIDASIWPYSTNGGNQASVFMIGEKCAQHIIDHSLSLKSFTIETGDTMNIDFNNNVLFFGVCCTMFLNFILYKFSNKYIRFSSLLFMLSIISIYYKYH